MTTPDYVFGSERTLGDSYLLVYHSGEGDDVDDSKYHNLLLDLIHASYHLLT